MRKGKKLTNGKEAPLFSAVLTVVLCLFSLSSVGCKKVDEDRPPQAKLENVKEVIHGEEVSDPYRWLEDVDSRETAEWVEAQNQLTFSYLESIPERDFIRQRLTDLWNYPRYGTPFKEGDRYFFFKNDGLQNQSL